VRAADGIDGVEEIVMKRMLCVTGVILLASGQAMAQDSAPAPELDAGSFGALRVRSVGPAFMSGRIGDIAVNPHNEAEWWIGVASGNVWKTTNGGTTYEPVFDNEGSFSIGCLAIDPNNPNVVWVGTGENNSQRSVAFGDGVYKTDDGGKTWQHLGLKDSQHIGMIAIDPRDSDTVFVAAQGPLWNSGGDRGLYKTTDGGMTWARVLHVSDDTGISEIHLDPRDPDTMYASAYQRRRHVWTLINGGPESAIYKSTDGGKSWRTVSRGLPRTDMGRIGMDISPVNPDVVFAIVEAAEDAGGFFRSSDRGETWERRSGYVTGSPQYYQEIVCHPTDIDTIFALDTYMQVSRDGGASWETVSQQDRHVDNHALWIDPDMPQHMVNGNDGGVYETWDGGETWRFSANLPITQFYRVAVDDAEPFYNIVGGTQDNASQIGPSRTIDRVGIANDQWYMTVMGDGFESRIEPGDPNTVYSLVQYGELVRYDRRSMEIVDIKPQEKPGEDPYVWNWDAPFIVSAHEPARLYFAGDRLFRSNDRGNSWETISGDLTRNIDRNTLKVMGRIQTPEAVAKHSSTSIYGNATALAESPVDADVLWVGTDDGLIHTTRDGGETWTKTEAFPGVPHLTYVSFLQGSLHEPGRVYAAFNNHKMGDFAPYLLRSDDYGQSWTNIAGDLPARNFVWTIAEDHENADLLFCGTEFGAYYSVDGGEHWIEIAGLPTIAVRDLEIQRRENDLVMATFGRSFYVLDDYSPLREADALDSEAHIFPVKDALSYIQTSKLGMASGRGFQGDSYYAAENPPFGAVVTYHLKDGLKTREERRKAGQTGDDWDYPTVEQFRAEDEELSPRIVLTFRNDDGEVVRRLNGSRSAGVHRMAWDLRGQAPDPISLRPRPQGDWSPPTAGSLVLPGEYTVTLSKEVDGEWTDLAGPVSFEVTALDLATYAATGKAREDAHAFRERAASLSKAVDGAMRIAGETEERITLVRRAIEETPDLDPALLEDADRLRKRMIDLMTAMRGDRTLGRRALPDTPSIAGRVGRIVGDQWWVTSAPTQTQRDQFEFASEAFDAALDDLESILSDLEALEGRLDDAEAPWTPGRMPEWRHR
jgi:photosystem II stability/assembly factor-like uncharacterized protein